MIVIMLGCHGLLRFPMQFEEQSSPRPRKTINLFYTFRDAGKRNTKAIKRERCEQQKCRDPRGPSPPSLQANQIPVVSGNLTVTMLKKATFAAVMALTSNVLGASNPTNTQSTPVSAITDNVSKKLGRMVASIDAQEPGPSRTWQV